MLFAASLFVVSLGGIAGLFALKRWEEKKGSIVFPRIREKIDTYALHLNAILAGLQQDLEKVPGEMLHLARIAVHEAMISAAGLLRFLERKAHELADMVSHKHRFERKAARSEFLQKVLEHKNGGGAPDEVENRP